MVNENGEPLYVANSNMPSSNNHPRQMVLHHQLDLFNDTTVVCSNSKCKGMKGNPQHVKLTHYINDQLPKEDGLIPPTVVKHPIGDIKKTHRNTSLFSFFENIETKSTMFHPKLANLDSLYVESIESLVSQIMISILTKTSLLRDPKSCTS